MKWRSRIKGKHLMLAGAVLFGVWGVMLLTGAEHAAVVSSTASVWVILGYFSHCDAKKRAASDNSNSA
ncbi:MULTISPECIES: hypothetical protein [Pseudomonas]|jgi:hypothetical protein|uniref:Uncharacterized protein n=1 Tax=Pseudomonas kielensis TaxID=2762577 RepID=A0A7X1GHY5_9PSED|nr:MULTISPECIES: hypothetical protein [Pseudomonas]MBC2692721.1 hypothetical protein [Pseudomonas kielensis]NBB36632.1 hypothetical protein [Pseudomonas sp. BC115LW]UZM16357.1 hypothetical protein LZV00_12000 [Pseudomonas kielensis]WKL51504.1 hypothetical protein Q1W70_18740 [Pseudomonas kielensis]